MVALSDQFFVKLNEVAQRLEMNPRDLLLCMYLESGVNPASKSHDPRSSARGLLGFLTSTLRGMGLSKEEANKFQYQPGEYQLDYVEKLINSSRKLIGGKPFTSATQYEHANFFPMTLGRWRGTDPMANSGTIVAAKDAKSPKEREAYEVNKSLDHGKKGAITVGDLTQTLMGLSHSPGFQTLMKRLNTVAGPGTITEAQKMKPQKETIMKEPISKPEGGVLEKFLEGLSKFLDAFGSNKPGCLISIGAMNVDDKIEFARVLSGALKEEFNINSSIHSDNQSVEVLCDTKDIDKVKCLVLAMSDAFKFATKKLGGIEISTIIAPNSVPHYQELGINIASTSYRKFHLKFAQGK